MILRGFWKPWFVYRPSQLLRRVFPPSLDRSSSYPAIETAWGLPIHAHPSRAIGRSILTTGVFDLAVSEVLVRLIDGRRRPGSAVVDAGANVGYMTVLMALAAGSRGRVLSFEPHPDLFAVLRQNVAEATDRAAMAQVELHNVALGDRHGFADLLLTPEFASNDGTARVVSDASTGPGHHTIKVPICTLDDVLGNDRVQVLKLDVEGFETQVLAGARRALSERRITHIVFEEHDVGRSETACVLRARGYQLFALGWTFRCLRLVPIDAPSPTRGYEAPSFVATLEPDDVLSRCRPGGWRTLGRL